MYTFSKLFKLLYILFFVAVVNYPVSEKYRFINSTKIFALAQDTTRMVKNVKNV